MLTSLLMILASNVLTVNSCQAVNLGYGAALSVYPSHERRLVQAVSFSRAEPWCGGWSVVTIYRRVGGSGSDWELSRSTGDGKSYAIATQWTTSDLCPAVLSALQGIEQIPVRLGVPYPIRAGDPPPKAIHAVPDAVGYRLWTNSYADTGSHVAYVEMKAGSGAVAAWVNSALESLKPCLA